MTIGDVSGLMGAIGPTAAVLLFMWANSRPKGEAKPDPAKDMAEALASIRERLVRIETLMGVKDKE